MVGESNKNISLIQIDASSFALFEISKFEIRLYMLMFQGKFRDSSAGKRGAGPQKSQPKRKKFKGAHEEIDSDSDIRYAFREIS